MFEHGLLSQVNPKRQNLLPTLFHFYASKKWLNSLKNRHSDPKPEIPADRFVRQWAKMVEVSNTSVIDFLGLDT